MYVIYKAWGFPGGSVIIRLPMQETLVGFLGWENPLEERMATHSTILACKIAWTEEPCGLHSMGHKDLDPTG